MAKWQEWERGMRWCRYKALSPPFRIRGFWGTVPAIYDTLNSPQLKVGRYLGLRATSAHIADLSPQFVTARRIFADLSTNRYGSVIATVQPLLR